MPPPRFQIHVEVPEPGLIVLAVDGELDLATVEQASAAFHGVEEQEPRAVLLDLTDCTHIDSRGIAAMVGWRELLGSETPFAAVSAQTHIKQIFDLGHLDEVFPLFKTREKALEWLRQRTG